MSDRTVKILVGMILLAVVLVLGTIALHATKIIQDGPWVVIPLFTGLILACISFGTLKVGR